MGSEVTGFGVSGHWVYGPLVWVYGSVSRREVFFKLGVFGYEFVDVGLGELDCVGYVAFVVGDHECKGWPPWAAAIVVGIADVDGFVGDDS